MKKLFAMAVLLLSILTANAQTTEVMTVLNIKGDEFTETKDTKMWKSHHVTMTKDVDGESIIALYSDGHIFTGKPVKAALYNDNGELVVVINMWATRTSEDGTTCILVDNGFSKDSIPGAENLGGRYMIARTAFIDYMISHHLYARFYTFTYGDYPWDYMVGIKPE